MLTQPNLTPVCRVEFSGYQVPTSLRAAAAASGAFFGVNSYTARHIVRHLCVQSAQVNGSVPRM